MRRRSQSTALQPKATSDDSDSNAERPAPPAARRRARRLDKNQIDLAEAAYAEGLTLNELASAIGVGSDTLSKHLKQRGVNTRAHDLIEAQIDEAVQLYATGWSLARIGHKFGVYPQSIRYRLLQRGVRLRRRSGW